MLRKKYRLILKKAAVRDLKKLDKPLREAIDGYFAEIRKSPYSYDSLVGKFKSLFSYHFSFKGTSYRIVYGIEDSNVVVVMVGKREKFYEKLSKRI